MSADKIVSKILDAGEAFDAMQSIIVLELTVDEAARQAADQAKELSVQRQLNVELANEYYRLQQEFEKVAHTDDLTGLNNRVYFQKQVKLALTEILTHNNNLEFAILNLDLDKFKGINDKHGHAAGDKLLMEVGNCLKNFIRHSEQYTFSRNEIKNTAARPSGDEFNVIIFSDTSQSRLENEIPHDNFEILAQERLENNINNLKVQHESEELAVHGSVGAYKVTLEGLINLIPDDYKVVDSSGNISNLILTDKILDDLTKKVIHEADQNMYARKHERKLGNSELKAPDR